MQQERGTTEFFPVCVFKIILAYLGYDSWKYIMWRRNEGKGEIKWPEKKNSSTLVCFTTIINEKEIVM